MMLKRSIVMGLLCFAGHAYSAEIAVTTTDDNDVDDSVCSLREAIQYINAGMPKEGYHGCGGESAVSIILLEKQATYKLKSRIDIKAGLTLKTTYDSTENQSVAVGLNNATIQMDGQDQIFHIDDGNKALITVNFQEVSFQGCGTSVCASLGGIIYNNEKLTLQSSALKGGRADKGGAIYNVGFSSESASLGSVVQTYNVLFENNQANNGAAIYSVAPNFWIASSVFKGNTGDVTIYTENPLANASSLVFPARDHLITNSTFFKNSGFALNLKDGIGLNNLTIIKNGGGVLLDVQDGQGYLANSILLGNGTASGSMNCKVVDQSTDKSVIYNNLLTAECPTAAVENNNTVWAKNDLIAGEDEGVCKNLNDDTTSLLCPYSVPNNAFLGYLRPRILVSFADIFSGPILNKGQTEANGNKQFVACESTDQRDKSRETNNLWCDRGAIEIIVPTSIPRIGDDIKPGQTAKFNILQYLGDSDLIPKEQCDAVVGKNPTGAAWQDGCLVIKQTQTVSKGKTTLNLNGDLEYIPNGAWHGADIFELQVVTSSTRYNPANKYISAEVRIYQEPDNDIDSKSVKTSGGAFGLYGLMGLFGLIGLRRLKK